MVNTAREMRQAGLTIPIMIGGATTSQLHVALKIAIEYDGPVVWMKDADQNVLAAARLSNAEEKKKYEHELVEKYAQLREKYAKEQQRIVSLEEARRNRLNLFDQE